jgi:hypothetical protein
LGVIILWAIVNRQALLLGYLIMIIAVLIFPFVIIFSLMGFGMSGELALNPGDHSKQILQAQLLFLSCPIINVALFLFGLFIVKRCKNKEK